MENFVTIPVEEFEELLKVKFQTEMLKREYEHGTSLVSVKEASIIFGWDIVEEE